MKTQEIRDRYREFFVSRGHEAWPSDSLTPRNDPTLLFSSAGMVQFKPYFRGEMGDTLKRVTTCQKCFRTSDIENVGHTERHHTFFEMLGNFSFGDYFKREAIRWAWEFSIDEMKLPVEKLWASIYENDEESAKIWLEESDIPAERIVRLGAEDNFWPASGILGPSGPCSELYYDQGPGVGCGKPTCAPGCDCDRYLEYWNLVFTQFDRQPDGSLPPLDRKNIDTGLGLERMACIMQGVHSNFDTDTLSPIIRYFEERTGYKFHDDKTRDVSFRVLADHIRAVTFVLTDNVMPSNTGRGYVLRRIMRRAIRHGLVLGLEKDLLASAMEIVVDVNKKEYPDLAENFSFTRKIAAAEEEAFRTTLNRGLVMLGEMIDEMKPGKEAVLPGEKAFLLYDTYGFPADLTKEILKERGFAGYDEESFQNCMEEQRTRAQAAWRGSGETKVEVEIGVPATIFSGYESLVEESTIWALFHDKKRIESAIAGQEVEIVVEKTPFYAESGGQVGDKGVIEDLSGNDAAVRIETTHKTASGVYVHFGVVERGIIREKDPVRLVVDRERRLPIQKNHTATHLLHAALRQVLGTHVKQSGSLVDPDYFRFDFTHFEAMKSAEIQKVEEIVNRWVYENHPVKTEITSLKDAQAKGAMALFGEKYGDQVRTVAILNEDADNQNVSLELCGGTHVRATGDIGYVRILTESSISAGNRRIEAISGPKAVEFIQKEHEQLRAIASILKVAADETPERVNRLLEQIKNLEKENKELRQKLLRGETTNLLDGVAEIGGIAVLTREMDGGGKEELQAAMDALMSGAKKRVAVLAAAADGKLTIVCGVSDDLTNRLDAGKIVKEITKITGGGGGGRKDRAQAGGKDASKLQEAFAKVKEIVTVLS
ncbi:MAG: alanine--tRNA ligase [Candidatus Omnitrophota bacterium]|jgi:alanyl-tRNA synthetase|nr:MAG: alanine--tRNA ligase [Candidatus Omnitrophota bacterium]